MLLQPAVGNESYVEVSHARERGTCKLGADVFLTCVGSDQVEAGCSPARGPESEVEQPRTMPE